AESGIQRIPEIYKSKMAAFKYAAVFLFLARQGWSSSAPEKDADERQSGENAPGPAAGFFTEWQVCPNVARD
ncbi:MAG: hypothetical protein WBN31_01760, partial [Gammaproteobacteria bacterium]